jgi:hypothetical protein
MGKKVFIKYVELFAPWEEPENYPINSICEGHNCTRALTAEGLNTHPDDRIDEEDNAYDLIREYKEPDVYEAYLVVMSDEPTGVAFNLETATALAKSHSNQGRIPWKIIKLTGTEDDDTVRSSDFNPLAHEQCK